MTIVVAIFAILDAEVLICSVVFPSERVPEADIAKVMDGEAGSAVGESVENVNEPTPEALGASEASAASLSLLKTIVWSDER